MNSGGKGSILQKQTNKQNPLLYRALFFFPWVLIHSNHNEVIIYCTVKHHKGIISEWRPPTYLALSSETHFDHYFNNMSSTLCSKVMFLCRAWNWALMDWELLLCLTSSCHMVLHKKFFAIYAWWCLDKACWLVFNSCQQWLL